ncbi:hypothetical protein AVEN_117549-1 [Araneus ventricosus]|uniref:Uncharacterized protein n=1 Tax=Araneus ventricosus TaxID=182803 RepID=A0A4Y2ILU8_ARAVE|nr:hypothetical protein AVEN_117549-1 [Araneus ventricosus]
MLFWATKFISTTNLRHSLPASFNTLQTCLNAMNNVSFFFDKVVERDRHNCDFKYLHSEKTAGIKSYDRDDHGKFQDQLMMLCCQRSGAKRALLDLQCVWLLLVA